MTNSNKINNKDPPNILHIGSRASIIHIGNLDAVDLTEGGKNASKKILDYLETGNKKSLKTAIEIYDKIIPKENFFRGEYTALRWICRLLLSSKKERKEFLSHSMIISWFDLLTKDNFANLKEYLNKKYGLIEDHDREKLRFLEDFILFNNPNNERWDRTNQNIKSLNLRKGYSIIDLGCGPGYFTFKFADIIGDKGHVYGIESNDLHINYVRDYIEKYHVNNVDIIKYQQDGWGFKNSTKVDIIFICSLYHIIYLAFNNRERDIFIENIRNHLKEDGRLIIVDNNFVENEKSPCFGNPFISPELIISQLWHYGFEPISQYQFTPQRYAVEFKILAKQKISGDDIDNEISTPAMFIDKKSTNIIRVTSPSSLVRYRVASSRGYTLPGKKAARLFYEALEKQDKSIIEIALKTYEELIPKERIGDDYTALLWFCKYLLASVEQKTNMLRNKFDAEYFNYLAEDDFSLLKKYIRTKYDLAKPDPELHESADDVVYEYSGDEVSLDQLNNWNEFISFNDPNRESWEKTSEMINYLNTRDGETVADIGCGFGFFSFKFSQLVGKNGKVYSTEINKDALEYVEKINNKYGLNIQTIRGELNDVCLPPDSVDTIFMCSMYHVFYISSMTKDEFIASLKRALKTGGRLVVVDNEITRSSIPAYFGPGIAKELIISQLKYYGFRLVDSKEFIPQRYILVFQQD